MRFVFFLAVVFICRLASAQSNNNTLLWEVSGSGLSQPSYLFGTMHVRDKRVFQFGDSVLICFDRCGAVAGELILDEAKENKMQLAKRILMPGDTTLSMLISKADFDLVKKKAKKSLGIYAMMINRMKPIFTMAAISEAQMGKDSTVSLDEYFQKRGKKRGMKLIGVETVEEQLAAIDVISLQEQAQMLVESVKGESKDDKVMDDLMDAYAAQDLDKIQALVESPEMPEIMSEAILLKRNHVMADRIKNIVEAQPTFVAVGAAHLPGREGVIALLREKGYSVRPILSRQAGETSDASPVKGKKEGNVYEATDKSFQVHFPENYSSKNMGGTRAVVAQKDGALYTLSEEKPQKKSAKKYFRRKLKDFEEAGIKVLSTKKYTVGKLPVLRILTDQGGLQTVLSYYYLNKTKAVELGVTGSKEAVESAPANQFLESLTVR